MIIEDHLYNITEAITQAVTSYTRGEPATLDFSNLRSKGAATSTGGTSTGPVSFIKLLDSTLATLTTAKTSQITVILKGTHPDYKEYKEFVPKVVAKVTQGPIPPVPPIIPEPPKPINKHGEALQSWYKCLETGSGPMHVHIDHDVSGVKKCFINLPPLGTEISGMASVLGIVISKYLEKGGQLQGLIKHLQSVAGDRPFGFGDSRILSIPHGLATIFKEFLAR